MTRSKWTPSPSWRADISHTLKNTIIDGALEPWFRGWRMASLTTEDIGAYMGHRQERGYANGPIHHKLSELKRMFTPWLSCAAGEGYGPDKTMVFCGAILIDGRRPPTACRSRRCHHPDAAA